MRGLLHLALAAVLLGLAHGDLYLHFPRGSNNRLDETNRNRENANRLFDSQNNNKGGYNQNNMNFYSGSIMQIEWTNQHSCNDENAHCELIMQYSCDNGTAGVGLRDGQLRTTITTQNPNDYTRGRHEAGSFYSECSTRMRNKGLFLADRNLNGQTAKFTRQNPNGDRFGFECPEERDYYPYWHPTPWIDIAILTSNTTRCSYYQAESQNVVNKGHCTGTKQPVATNPTLILTGAYYNNEADCNTNGFTWVSDSAWGVPAPACAQAPWSRDNHLGNGLNGWANTYQWTLPTTTTQKLTCVFRMRYNISTGDYDGWNTYAQFNGAASPVKNNPTLTLSPGVTLQLAVNPAQYGRTFQDRSSVFEIWPRPSGVALDSNIYNLNVKGQRGNIVQNFPAVEYDFVPTTLSIQEGDYVHRQVSGSNTTPAGAGQGRESTDRSNFVQINDLSLNYPTLLSKVTMVSDPTNTGFDTVKLYALLGQNDNELDDAAPHQDFGLMQYSSAATYHYMSTRNNNFSNRSQKGTLIVTSIPASPSPALPSVAVAGIVIASILVPAVAAVVIYGLVRPESKVGKGLSWLKAKIRGQGSTQAPRGYVRAPLSRSVTEEPLS